jgi:quercetin dioxygenase-like cupin family protein/DNA-binding Xre family transcriptional regulator
MLHGLQFILDRPAMPTSPAQSTSLASVGSALRQVRNARSLSLADVAEATGISASFLSLVENDRSDITIGRLVRLIDFYGISITDLLPFSARPDYPEVIRPDERRSLQSPVEGIDIYLLTADTDRQMMPLEVCFKPGARLAEPGRHAGEEWLLVLDGELRLELEGAEARVLGPGDTAYYPAERPHLLSNASETKPLRVVCVDTPPTM